ncbi:CoA-binding protein [Bacteroidetes/Chlorobi group bacterium ChocPot_Mid]|nr:MAG: CoA-binding protein [Bacteroidetes/Chlorobi group bacterium ChocPot_Mid]
MNEVEIMRNTKSFAIIGASAKEDSYGFKLVKSLTDVGYKVFPINPKYPDIYGLTTYNSTEDLPELPENIVLAMSAVNNLKVLNSLQKFKSSNIWLPPECWNDELVNKAVEMNLNILKDLCPIGTYLKLNFELKKENN